MRGLWLLIVVGFASTAQAGALDGFMSGAPLCSVNTQYCLGVRLHVVVRDGRPVQSAEWFHHQLSEANRHFEPMGVGFQLVSVRPHSSGESTIKTRRDRDLLGRKRFRLREIDVHLVQHLYDIHTPGTEIRGVHWRDGARPFRHWVVLSSIADGWVLAHELGHFFSLPHSEYPISIMNKTPREEPPEALRSFAPAEYRKMRWRLRHYLKTRKLVPIQQRRSRT